MACPQCYLPIPPRVWSRVQNSCSVETTNSNNSFVRVPYSKQIVPGSQIADYLAMLNKGNVLQYKANSSNLTQAQKYSKIAKGQWVNRNTTWATQSTRGYTNPNTTSLKRAGNVVNIALDPITGRKLGNTTAPVNTCPQPFVPVNPVLPINNGGGGGSNIPPVPPPVNPTPGSDTFPPIIPVTPVQPIIIPDGGTLVCSIQENICTGETKITVSQQLCNLTTASDVPGPIQELCWNDGTPTWYPRQRYKMSNSTDKWPTNYKFLDAAQTTCPNKPSPFYKVPVLIEAIPSIYSLLAHWIMEGQGSSDYFEYVRGYVLNLVEYAAPVVSLDTPQQTDLIIDWIPPHVDNNHSIQEYIINVVEYASPILEDVTPEYQLTTYNSNTNTVNLDVLWNNSALNISDIQGYLVNVQVCLPPQITSYQPSYYFIDIRWSELVPAGDISGFLINLIEYDAPILIQAYGLSYTSIYAAWSAPKHDTIPVYGYYVYCDEALPPLLDSAYTPTTNSLAITWEETVPPEDISEFQINLIEYDAPSNIGATETINSVAVSWIPPLVNNPDGITLVGYYINYGELFPPPAIIPPYIPTIDTIFVSWENMLSPYIIDHYLIDVIGYHEPTHIAWDPSTSQLSWRKPDVNNPDGIELIGYNIFIVEQQHPNLLSANVTLGLTNSPSYNLTVNWDKGNTDDTNKNGYYIHYIVKHAPTIESILLQSLTNNTYNLAVNWNNSELNTSQLQGYFMYIVEQTNPNITSYSVVPHTLSNTLDLQLDWNYSQSTNQDLQGYYISVVQQVQPIVTNTTLIFDQTTNTYTLTINWNNSELSTGSLNGFYIYLVKI